MMKRSQKNNNSKESSSGFGNPKMKYFGEGVFWRHMRDFPYVWLFFLSMFVAAICALLGFWGVAKIIGAVSVLLLVTTLLFRPMNAVYGLMGSTGSIKLFFRYFVAITFIFALIYHFGFFHNAAISYDVNQPHVYYNYSKNERPEQIEETVYLRITDGVEIRDTVYQIINYNYQPITFGMTFRNTIMTTLMQEPTDFFAVASTYNSAMDREGKCIDQDKAAMFHWLLIFQILISWIFFGVFISLLYNKFRYES